MTITYTKSHDTSGVEWARLSQLKPGATVRADDGFTCIKDGAVLVVGIDDRGSLFVPCSDGEHHLDGQCDDGDHCIGLQVVSEP
jgi:hypothetical protein